MENSKAAEIFNKWMDCKDAYQADPSCDGNCLSCEYYTSAEGEKEAMLLAIAALEKQEQDRWRPATENPKKPKYQFDTYLVYTKYERFGVADFFADGRWIGYDIDGDQIDGDEITAWRPLPEKYKEEDKA